MGDGPFDLIVSLISSGFPYPMETDLDRADNALAEGGVVVLDVREGSGGESVLRDRFAVVDELFRDRKRIRLACRR